MPLTRMMVDVGNSSRRLAPRGPQTGGPEKQTKGLRGLRVCVGRVFLLERFTFSSSMKGVSALMDLLPLISRLAHILAAITLAGGLFYECAVVLPQINNLSGGQTLRTMRGTWAKMVMVSALFLILSGFYNYFRIIQMDKAGLVELPKFYHPLIGIKILLAFFLFFMTSLLAGRSAATERLQRKAAFWLPFNATVAVVIVVIACVLRMADKAPAPTQETLLSSSSNSSHRAAEKITRSNRSPI